MSNVTVCARFRPLSSKEIKDHGDSTCIQLLDAESFVFKDEKGEDSTFRFDRVFYQESEQSDVYEFLALPIVKDAVNAVNGTILAYGQTGAGKTYSMEGANIFGCDGNTKGLLPRVVDEIFECLTCANVMTVYTVKLSMVEIYMEKVRDLLDFSKDNLQIKEDKVQGIHLSGVTEISISDPAEALQNLSGGIANRAVGETNMNMASSRSHCVYIFTIQQEQHRRVKIGKLVLVDLAGSEKIEKTGAEGKVLEEAKTINKSLSALGNVINALTSGTQGKLNHIPYRDSKLTRILQDALGGNSRTALLCCCSPSTLNASESLSTLRFGARAKHIKTSPRVNIIKYKNGKEQLEPSPTKDESCERTLDKSREKLKVVDVKLEEVLLISSDSSSVKFVESAYEYEASETISMLQRDVEKLDCTVRMLKRENRLLKAKHVVLQTIINSYKENERKYKENERKYLSVILCIVLFFFFYLSFD
ncbi:kinesin-like protein KIN-1 isoform X2 [Macadamia integrifolia]|uniref:kinesin-like protein KIN-1 isoform X2 n=1 Tax=Macadamia integrifolia TaxID=60698 RepID=UPI001C52EB1A|nr:kinesin-like protein KIN-1 isoform X2 [Macadamia integrifolia]